MTTGCAGRWQGWRLWVVVCLLETTFATGAPAGDGPQDAAPLAATEVLDRAFTARYELDMTSVIELVVHNQEGQQRTRRLRATTKRIGGRVHSIGRLVEPEYLRGMTILTIEAKGRNHDAFLYLPSLDRVRRITTAHRGDSVFGTDVTYEDLERQRIETFEIMTLRAADETEWMGEPSYLVEATPRRAYNYGGVHFVVAREDFALLATRYFKRGATRPYRVVTADRADMLLRDGIILPTRLSVQNLDRGTRTEVHLTELSINPPIDDHLFSVQALEAQRPLPVQAH